MVTRRWCGREAAEKAESAKEVAADAIAAVKPKLRGVSHEWAFFVSLGLGAGADHRREDAEGDPRGRDLRGQPLGPARHQRPLPPGQLDAAQRPPLDAPARPLDDLLPHRRHLHALRPAGARRPARRRDPRRRLGRRDRRRDRRDGLDRPPEMGRGADLHVARLGRRRRLPRALERDGRRRHPAGRRRRPPLHGRRRRLRDPAPEPEPAGLRLPRGLPPARDRRRRRPLRRDRLLRPAGLPDCRPGEVERLRHMAETRLVDGGSGARARSDSSAAATSSARISSSCSACCGASSSRSSVEQLVRRGPPAARPRSRGRPSRPAPCASRPAPRPRRTCPSRRRSPPPACRSGRSAPAGREAQSSAFFSWPGIEWLYSGVAIRTASASRIASRSSRTASGAGSTSTSSS